MNALYSVFLVRIFGLSQKTKKLEDVYGCMQYITFENRKKKGDRQQRIPKNPKLMNPIRQ